MIDASSYIIRCKSNEVYTLRSPGVSRHARRMQGVRYNFDHLLARARYLQQRQTRSLCSVDKLRIKSLGSSVRQVPNCISTHPRISPRLVYRQRYIVFRQKNQFYCSYFFIWWAHMHTIHTHTRAKYYPIAVILYYLIYRYNASLLIFNKKPS